VFAFRRQLPGKALLAVGLLQATSLPFLLTVTAIGTDMGILEESTAAALVAAGIVSVLVFPTLALRLLASSDASAPHAMTSAGA
jgi:hypothetical protein